MTRADPYAALAAFAEPARQRSETWRTALGVVLIGAAYGGGLILVLGLFARILEPAIGAWAAARFVEGFVTGRTAPGLTLLLYSFALMALPVALVTRFLHRRPVSGLLGPPGRALRDALRVTAPILALTIVLMPLVVMSDDAGRRLTLSQWTLWLPVALPGLIVQVGAEELLFRGYLQQQLAARSRNPIIWMVMPSVLFGWLHFAPGEFGANAALIAVWAGLFGLMAADLTARTGTIGAAFGLHFATNFSSIFLVGLWGQLDGLALWNVVVNLRDPAAVLPLLAIDIAALIVSWLVARLALRV